MFTDAQLHTAVTFIQQAAQRPIDDERKTTFAVARTQAALKIPMEDAKLLVEAGVKALDQPPVEPPTAKAPVAIVKPPQVENAKTHVDTHKHRGKTR